MVGKTLGHYEILEPLGKGGMGEVYRARDTTLERDVAIKVLPEDFATDPGRLARLEREAKLLAALNHPHIATIHSLEEADGSRFLVLELVDGESLAQKLVRGALPVREALDVCKQIAQALETAHREGIIHRDLKPANVVITSDGRAKVLDFGIAKSVGAEGRQAHTAKATDLTAAGTVTGTAPYMSPEQVRGGTVDKRSDNWALGCVLYEALTGRQAFARETIADTLSAVLEHEPDWDALPAATPVSVTNLVSRCLQKNPDSRLHDVADARIEIDEALQAMSTTSPAYGAHGRRPKRRWIAVAGASLLAAGTVTAASLLWLRPSTPPADVPAIVVLPFDNIGAAENEYFAAGMTAEITSGLAALSGLKVISRKSALRYAGTDLSTREIGEELDVDYVLIANVRWDLGGQGPSQFRITPALIRVADDTQLWSERFDGVNEDIFTVQGDIGDRVIEQLGVALLEGERMPLSTVATRNADAYDLYLRGQYFRNKRTEEDIQIGLAAFQEAIRLDPGYSSAWVGIAQVGIFRGWYSVLAPTETYPGAKDAVTRALELDESLAEAHTSLAHIHLHFDHDWEAAEREYELAIELDERSPLAHHWFSRYLAAMGRRDEALEHALRARELDPFSLIINTWVGVQYYLADRNEEAIEEFQAALQLNAEFPPAHWHLGWAYEQTGRYEEAIAAAEAALRLSGGSPLYLASLGHAYAKAGDDERARETLVRLEQESVAGHVSAYHTAVIHVALGDYDSAFEWLDRAFEDQSPWIGFLRVDPRVDDLRTDARFAALLSRAQLDG